MQFGSVEFFKVLIKTVLCILFFVPLVLCVVFAVLLWNSNQKQAELAQDNQKLEYYAEILSGEREPTVKGFYDIYERSGLSDDDLVEYILHGREPSEQANADAAATEPASSQVQSEPEASTVPTVDSAEPTVASIRK